MKRMKRIPYEEAITLLKRYKNKELTITSTMRINTDFTWDVAISPYHYNGQYFEKSVQNAIDFLKENKENAKIWLQN